MAIPTSLPPQLHLNTTVSKTAALSVGQILTLSILKVSGQTALLQVGSQQLNASINSDYFRQNSFDKPLQFQVTQLKPTVSLKLMPETALPQDSKTQLLQATLRQVLPNQINLAQGVLQLNQLVQSGALPTILQSHLTSLFESLFRLRPQLSASDVRNAILGSGLFLESNLSNQKRAGSQDLKASLLKLLHLAQTLQSQSPNSISIQKVIDSLNQMVNRITGQQIQNLENPMHTVIELPVSPNKELINFSIEIRKQQQESNDAWELLLTLELNEGQLVNKTVYTKEAFSFYFWAENQKLEQKVQSHLSIFEEQLKNSGIHFDKILLSKNKLEVTQNSQKVALIDIHI